MIELACGDFGALPDGRPVELYTLDDGDGLRAQITPYGGVLVRLEVPDREGQQADVVLGYDSLSGYLADHKTYFGALIGRYANRIAGGCFQLEGETHRLAINNAPNSIHGGGEGFNRKLWRAREISGASGPALELSYTSAEGEEGYPGQLEVAVTYRLDRGRLHLSYRATTSRPTVVNLTNHSYFNLAGAGSGNVLSTEIQIHARRFTPVDATFIPTGEMLPVAATPFDFTRTTALGTHIADPDPQLERAGGYDVNFVLEAGPGSAPSLAAEAYQPATGRRLRVLTTQPAVQLYTANHLDHVVGKGGQVYERWGAFCIETQHFPDSPNHPDFPSTEIVPGVAFGAETVYEFGID